MSLQEQIESGELVATKSLLALDEDLICRRCSHIFTLAEGNWEGTHPEFESIKAIGIQCPKCKRTNVAYYKTNKLFELEKRLHSAPFEKKRKLQAKYQREFLRVQKKYGGVSEISK